MRFGKKGKLSPRYIGPFEILERVGNVAYQLALPPKMIDFHNVFHVSMLKKYEPDPSYVLSQQDTEIRRDMSYIEKPIGILDQKDQVLRNRTIPLVKILWQHHTSDDATWE
ncbi:hypothetical protein AXF42_Ash012377 [Apostasia shenzhenica]|uniref:Tf2-1-like SH3-like domain-containing protein n=1 Tax=Apostasia shenzhenica TaxID=1088818 RepID=A0A2I0AD44_9ASPA|nr:hypothetical protein AXF42_Ash012377 [Apostasia shenzhenica]